MKEKFILRITLIVAVYYLLIPFGVMCQENVAITTYYPSPEGIYNQVVVNALGVGDTNISGSIDLYDSPDPGPHSGDMWVAQHMGVGTITSKNNLDVSGSVAIGVNYAGAVIAPVNGLIVEGDTGVGLVSPDITPAADLEVNGAMVLVPGSAPTALAGQDLEGTIYYSNSTHRLKYHDDAGWKDFGGLSLGATTVTVPSNPILHSRENVTTKATCPANYVVVGVRIYSEDTCPHDCSIWGGAGSDGYDTGRIERIAVICKQLQ